MSWGGKAAVSCFVLMICALIAGNWYMESIGLFWGIFAVALPGLAFLVMYVVWVIMERSANVVSMKEFNEERRQMILARQRRKR